MSGNTFGRLFTLTSFGESHGPAIGGVVDGCPPGMALAASDIQADLDRRRPGASRFVSQRAEPDTVEILSGVFEGRTTGAPIGFVIRNRDPRSADYQALADVFRPGHADYTYAAKYGIRDPRGGGRASARETAVRVAAGAIARKWLAERFGVRIFGWVGQIGAIDIPFSDADAIAQNPFFVPDSAIVPRVEAYIDALREVGDSAGARLCVVARGVPPGWGDPVYDRLDASIAYAMMGINAVKGVEIGAGFASVAQKGSENGDERTPEGFLSNHAGGVLGGISTGQEIRVSLAVKPTPSIRRPRRSVDAAGNAVVVETRGRHDPCVGIRAVPVAEAMLALTLIDHALRDRAQCADLRRAAPPEH
jgi:chorismate synthase